MRLPRASGVLLHPTSLPGPHGSGDLGKNAYYFVDWLAGAKQSLWQVLPLGGIGPGNSPYMSTSAFAGNVLLIDLKELQEQGWLTAADLEWPTGELATHAGRIDFAAMVPFRMERLAKAAQSFAHSASDAQRQAYVTFCAEHGAWLDDYALFMALSEAQAWKDWCDWPAPLCARKPEALAAARAQHAQRVAFWRFCQWCFFRQWLALKRYANEKGVRVVGDAPIFIAYHSAEAWARPELFELGADRRPTVVAGVPPDFFSATGQRWGNPLYRWSAHAAEGYAWWVQRVQRLFDLVDLVRIDHFRGFAGYWEIPASEPTAIKGQWKPGPGAALFEAIQAKLGRKAILAEDLGMITPDVDDLRRRFGYPGMRILQFAFGGAPEDRFLPHNHEPDTVVYTGTHDNDTTMGWWAKASDEERDRVRRYLASDGQDMAWALIRAAMASVADTAVHPLQDLLALGTDCRMNLPGEPSGWWAWRFDWNQVQPWHAQRLAELTATYGRAPAQDRARCASTTG